MKPKIQKFRLGKQTISNLTNQSISQINGGSGNWTWTLTATLISLIEQTCKCTFPPKCGSDNIKM
jgi:hypothetical protein